MLPERSLVASFWICALCVGAVLSQRDRDFAPLRPPKNQYVGIDQDFQFYVPTVNQPVIDTNRHRFGSPQPQFTTPPPVPHSPLVGASLVSITSQNPEDYYDDTEEEIPASPRHHQQQQRIGLEQQRIYEEQYRRAQEQYRKDEEYRREEIRRLEVRDRENTRIQQQQSINRNNQQAQHQRHFQNPAPTARPLQSVTNFVGLEEQPRQTPHQPQQPTFTQRHHQPQTHAQINHRQHHNFEEHHQPQPHHNPHIIHPHISKEPFKIDPFAALKLPSNTNNRQSHHNIHQRPATPAPHRNPAPQRIPIPLPESEFAQQEDAEEAYVPQSLFAKVDSPIGQQLLQHSQQQERIQTRNRFGNEQVTQKPRLVIPQSRPRSQSPSVASAPTPARSRSQTGTASHRNKDYEEELFRQQADNAQYQFASGVHDEINGNHQERQEVRDGANVKGMYSFSDGFYKRTVFYEADDKGYRVVKEDVEPLGDGPQVNPRGEVNVNTYVDGNEVNYSIRAEDIQSKQVQQEQQQQQRRGRERDFF